MLSVNRIVSGRHGGDSSVPLGTGKASFGALSLVLGVTFQEECGSDGDGWKAARDIRSKKCKEQLQERVCIL